MAARLSLRSGAGPSRAEAAAGTTRPDRLTPATRGGELGPSRPSVANSARGPSATLELGKRLFRRTVEYALPQIQGMISR